MCLGCRSLLLSLFRLEYRVSINAHRINGESFTLRDLLLGFVATSAVGSLSGSLSSSSAISYQMIVKDHHIPTKSLAPVRKHLCYTARRKTSGHLHRWMHPVSGLLLGLLALLVHVAGVCLALEASGCHTRHAGNLIVSHE